MSIDQTNGRGINDGPLNGPPPTYVYGNATLVHTHTISADGQGYVDWQVPINSYGLNTGAVNQSYNGLYVDCSATLAIAHAVLADLTSLYLDEVVALTHDHALTGDLRLDAVEASSVMTHVHSIAADGNILILGSSVMTHTHALSADLSSVYVDGSTALTHDHGISADLTLFDLIYGEATLAHTHTLLGDLTLTPIVNGAAEMVHSHTLLYTDSESVYGQATLGHSHFLFGSALGGTPAIDIDNLWLTAEPILDIETRGTIGRKNQYFHLYYDVFGFQYWKSGLNLCALDTAPLDGSCSGYPEPDMSWELGMEWGVGETQWSLDMQYSYMYDVTQEEWELGQEWYLDVSTATLYKWELQDTHAALGKDYVNTLLGLVNTERQLLGLQPYSLYRGVGEDVATTHSQNMADTGILAHDDGAFPAGYQTSEQRITHIAEVPTGYAENLAASATSSRHFLTAQELFNAWWASPTHKANILAEWTVDDNPQMILGYAMLYDWSSAPGNWTTFYTQLFIGFGIPLGATVKQWELGQQYQVDTAIMNTLNTQYALDAYTAVIDQHSGVYGINVSVQHSAPSGSGVTVQHSAPIHFNLQTQHSGEWAVLQPIAADHEADYDIAELARVLQDMTSEYYINLTIAHTGGYSLNLNTVTQHSAPYEPSVAVIKQVSANYDILDQNYVIKAHTGFYAMIDGTATTITPTATLTVNGTSIDIQEAVIELAEGDLAWNASIILTDIAHYQLVNRGDTAVLDLLGELYDLVIQSKSLSRNAPAAISMRVNALSPSIKHRLPQCTLVDYLNTTAILAKDAVEDILGESVDWQLTNWSIPAYRISAEDAEPIELARTIVEAVGGVIEPKKDGSLLVRHSFPVNIPDYATATPDQVYTDVEDNLSVSEEFELRDDYNKFHILEGRAGFTDALEWEPNEDLSTGGVLRAYPTPWRTNIQIIHTDGVMVNLVPLGIRTRQETEIVEFTEGEGSLRHPAISLDTIDWKSDVLPSVSLELHSTIIKAGKSVNQGYGLAEITYTVESIDYESQVPLGNIVQYLLEDLG